MELTVTPAMGMCWQRPDGTRAYTLTTILGELLREAEQRFGARDRDWTILGVEFGGQQPCIWYPGGRRDIAISLSENARENRNRAIYQLAHEVIHLLAPVVGRSARVIEEGLAVCYSQEISERYRLDVRVQGELYIAAGAIVRNEVLSLGPHVVSHIRAQQPSFDLLTAADLRRMLPDLSEAVAAELCLPFTDYAQHLAARANN